MAVKPNEIFLNAEVLTKASIRRAGVPTLLHYRRSSPPSVLGLSMRVASYHSASAWL